jgi:hypothetical protein
MPNGENVDEGYIDSHNSAEIGENEGTQEAADATEPEDSGERSATDEGTTEHTEQRETSDTEEASAAE